MTFADFRCLKKNVETNMAKVLTRSPAIEIQSNKKVKTSNQKLAKGLLRFKLFHVFVIVSVLIPKRIFLYLTSHSKELLPHIR